MNTGVFPAGELPDGLGRGEAVGDEFKIVVSGPCRDDAETADIALPGKGISIGDGDIALDFKVLSGEQRAAISIYVRNSSGKLVGATINAATGEAKLFNFDQGNMTIIASRTDAGGLAIRPTGTGWRCASGGTRSGCSSTMMPCCTPRTS